MRETALARGKSVGEIACDFGAWGTVPECIAQNRSKGHRALTDAISEQAFAIALPACARASYPDMLVQNIALIDLFIFSFIFFVSPIDHKIFVRFFMQSPPGTDNDLQGQLQSYVVQQ